MSIMSESSLPVTSSVPNTEAAAFMGRITAAATHELRNVLAIIRESAGLVDDLLARSSTRALDADKLEWATGRIAAQVTRGAELCTSLNHVAHGLDRPAEAVALNVAVADTTLLCGRSARQRQRRLAILAGDGNPTVERNALQLYMGLAAVVEWCVERVPEGGTLAIRGEMLPTGPAVVFRSEPVWQTELAENGDLRMALDTEPLRSLAVSMEVPPPGSELLLCFH